MTPAEQGSTLLEEIDASRYLTNYLSRYMDRRTIQAYAKAGVWSPALLTPLHDGGCTPEMFRTLRRLGLPSHQIITLAATGWTQHTTPGVEPAVAAAYASVGVKRPETMKTLISEGVTAAELRDLAADPRRRNAPLERTVARLLRHEPLADRTLSLEGVTGPFIVTITDGVMSCLEQDRLGDEETLSLLGGAPSPVLSLLRSWRSRSPAMWAALGEQAGPAERRRLECALLSALLHRERAPLRRPRRRAPSSSRSSQAASGRP
jgi:hypothetical protein